MQSPPRTSCVGSSKAHSELVDSILREFGGGEGIRLWKQTTGFARRGRTGVKFGVKGWADIGGILPPHGRVIQIECKTGNATASKQQRRWREMILERGGLHILARSVDDVRAALLAAAPNGRTNAPV